MSIIDTSYWQHHPDFAQVKSSGVTRVIMKAADGEGGTIIDDSVYVVNRAAARAVGLAVGSYFFNGNATSPLIAAAHQWSIIDWRPGDIVAIDIEGAAGIEWNVGQALEWCRWMIGQGVPPALIFVYMSSSVDTSAWGPVWALGVQPWIAQYGPNDGNAHTPPSVPWAIWQYTSVGSCPGIVGNVDTNKASPDWASLNGTPLGENMPLDASDQAWLNGLGASIVDQVNRATAATLAPVETQLRADLGTIHQAILDAGVPVAAPVAAPVASGAQGASAADMVAAIKPLFDALPAAVRAAIIK